MAVVAVIFFESVDDFSQRLLVLHQTTVFFQANPDDADMMVGHLIDYR